MIALIRQLLAAFAGAFLYITGRRQAKTEAALDAAQAQAKANVEAAATLERIVNVPVLDANRARERMQSRDPGTR